MIIYIVLALYIAMMATIGFYSIKKADTLTSFVVGARKAGPWMTAFAYGTTYFSAVLFIGYAGRSGWDLGLWAILIGVGNAFLGTFLAWKILANRTRSVTRRLKIKTMPQLFERRYNSKNMKIFASVIIFVFMLPYSASVYSGLSYLCEIVFDIDYTLAMALIAFVAAVYLVLGGYTASLIADLIQGFIMIIGIIAMVISVMNSDIIGGFTTGISNLTQTMSEQGIGTLSPQMIISLISLILLTSVGTWGMPQMVHKFYGIADAASVKTGTKVSTVFCLLISVGAYFVGSMSRLFFSPEQVPSEIVPDMIIPQILVNTLSPLLLAIILVLVLSASVSTLSGITLTACSAISMDLLASLRKKDLQPKKTLLLTRILCLLFILISFILALMQSPILTLMSFSWGTISGAFLAPYLLGLYWKKVNKVGAWAGMLGGVATSLTLAISSGFNAANSSFYGITSIAVSFVIVIVVTALQKAPSEISDFFNEDVVA